MPSVVGGEAEWESFADELCVSLLNANAPGDPVEKCALIAEFAGPTARCSSRGPTSPPTASNSASTARGSGSPTPNARWPAPHEVTFFMTSGSPRITELTRDDTTGAFQLAVEPSAPERPIAGRHLHPRRHPDLLLRTRRRYLGSRPHRGAHQLHVTATDTAGNYDTATVDFVERDTASTITADPAEITADGTSTSTVTVRLADAGGNPITTGGDNVEIATDAGTLSTVTDNGDGTYSAILTSATNTGTATLSFTVNGTPATNTTAVAFTAGPADPVTSTITAAPTALPADGVSASTVTVTLVTPTAIR